VKAAAETFRPNPALDVERAITELAVGEALVSFLDEKGTPGIVERALVVPPPGQIGPITAEERTLVIQQSVIFGHYEQMIDRESAYEILKGRTEGIPATSVEKKSTEAKRIEFEKPRAEPEPETPKPDKPAKKTDSVVEAFGKSAARSVGSGIGRQFVRGVMGIISGVFNEKRK